MVIVLINTTQNNLSYVTGQVIVPANGQLSISVPGQIVLASDPNLISDISAGNIIVNDGVGNYSPMAGVTLINNISDSSSQLDSDGATLSRIKVAPSGWTFQLRCLEVTTSVAGGNLFNQDALGNILTDATVTFYDANGVVISDPTLLVLSCVKTVLDLEAPYNYYLGGGKLRILPISNSTDVRLSVIGAPDIPYALGGSHAFVQNANFKFIGASDEMSADGGAAKYLQYSATIHSNKIRFVITHPTGAEIMLGIFLETYRQ